MDLRELGALLKAERERQGLDVNDVIEHIKIGRTALLAIEDGDQGKLPHPVYAKGFIKNYAKFLNIDVDEVGEFLAGIYGVEDDAPRPVSPENRETVSSIRITEGPKRNSLIMVTVLLLLLVIGAAFWYVYFFNGKKADQAAAPAVGTTAPASESPAPNAAASQKPATPLEASSTEAPSPASGPSSPEHLNETPPPVETPVAPVMPAEPASASASPAIAPVLESPVSPPPAEEPLSDSLEMGLGPNAVEITARQDCWVAAGVDGGALNETTLKKGQRLTGRFEQVLLVRLGNSGGVEIAFNGKPYPFEGVAGKSKTLKFTAKKTETPAEAPAVAPPSATEQPAGETPPAASDTAVPGQENALEVFGTDGSWIIVVPDGGPSKEVFVKKGERLSFPFKTGIDVRMGNPSSVVFKYAGQERPVRTERGESKTVHFP